MRPAARRHSGSRCGTRCSWPSPAAQRLRSTWSSSPEDVVVLAEDVGVLAEDVVVLAEDVRVLAKDYEHFAGARAAGEVTR